MDTGFRLDGDRIRIADAVLVYLERVAGTPAVVADGTVPRPHGALPLALAEPGTVIAPALPGEAVWLGFQAVDRAAPAIVRVRIDEPEPVDAVTGAAWQDAARDDPPNALRCPPETRLVGRPVEGGRMLFGADPLTVFVRGASPTAAPVRFVAPAEFARRTGRTVSALDPGAAYSGRRLP